MSIRGDAIGDITAATNPTSIGISDAQKLERVNRRVNVNPYIVLPSGVEAAKETSSTLSFSIVKKGLATGATLPLTADNDIVDTEILSIDT